MKIDLFQLALGYGGQTVFLFVALWIMIKLQKLNYGVVGLAVSAMVASALDYVPYVGIELSVIVLLLCITKVIGARTFTDAIFTTGIAYAITFCFNLFVLGALLGDLRHPTEVRARTRQVSEVAGNSSVTNQPAEKQGLISRFEANVLKKALSLVAKAPANAAPVTPTKTLADVPTKAVAGTSSKPVTEAPASPSPEATAQSLANRGRAGQMASDVATHFTIRGISKGPVQTIAMIGNGTHTYDVAMGDSFQMQTVGGKASVNCVSVEESKVVLEVEGVAVTIKHKVIQ